MENVFRELWADKFVRIWIKLILGSLVAGIFGTILAQLAG